MESPVLRAAMQRFTVAALSALGQKQLAERVEAGDDYAAPELAAMASLLEKVG